jgi:oxygen-independent coproporphyrinogen-3 oxidase
MGLRTARGVDTSRYREITGKSLREAAIADLIELGHLEVQETQLRATKTGKLLLNSVIAALLK